MCGINGIFAFGAGADAIDRKELERTRDHMVARGPDGFGSWISSDERIGFGHRRLAIIDLSDAGLQPMQTSNERFTIVFNGEVYNFRSLRLELERKGYTFKTRSDTEVLLHLYCDKGRNMVSDIIGMFAFAIWDNWEKSLFLARDAYGIKPLYISIVNGTLRFASQLKALLAGGAISTQLDAAGWVGFHLFGSVPEPFTTFRDIELLPAGCSQLVTFDGPQPVQRFYSIAGVFAGGGSDRRERGPAMREALLDSVKRHLVSDVPVGAFLSAGIDSGALVGLMRDAGQGEIETVTLSFAEFLGTSNDEAPLAAKIAMTYGTRHTSRVVTRAEFEADLPLILEAMDQPSIDGVNTWFVSKAASERGLKVAISGVGGDELFGGYPSFKDVPRWVKWLSIPGAVPFLGAGLRHLAVALGPQRIGVSPKAAGLLEYGGDYPGAWMLRRGLRMPWELENDLLSSEMVSEGLARLRPLEMVRSAMTPAAMGSFGRIAALESSLYMRNQLLRDTDWASMAHSLEVRTPLADVALLEAAAAFAPPSDRPLLKADLAFAPLEPLPRAVVERRKTGFGVPTSAWQRDKSGSEASSNPHDGARDWASFIAGHAARGHET